MKRALGIAGVVLLLGAAFTLGLTLTRSSHRTATVSSSRTSTSGPRPIDEIRRELRTEYYRRVPERILHARSIRWMLASLDDPYTDYLTAEEYAELRSRTEATYGGVGLTVAPARDGLVVTSAPEGPARRAGIRPGDVIVSIDGKPAARLSFERSIALVKGERGTAVELTVQRAHAGKFQFRIVRDEIAAPSMQSRLLGRGKRALGYIRLLSFPEGTAPRVRRAAQGLVARRANGLILDLRANPGGLLAQAVSTVSLFLDEGVVCTTQGAHQERRVFGVTGGALYPRLPLVVLVDRRSASAAEIVAAALRENRRARVVGQRTYGKATVQTIRFLSNGGAFKFTTATYLTPSGSDIDRTGVRPDVRAIDDPETRRDEALVVAEKTLLSEHT